MRAVLLGLVTALLTVAAAMPASAQLAGTGTGSVVGAAIDASRAPIGGVDVSISGRTLMSARTTVTREDGTYLFAWLPPGDYVLTFAFPGLETLRRETHVGLGATVTIDITMSVARLHEQVGVVAALDRHSAAVSQSFDASELESLPGSRSLGGLFAAANGLALPVAEVGGGAGMVSGAYSAYGRNSSPRHTVEGIVVTGLFGAGFSPDYGALEEVSILTAGHGAEWPTAGIHTDIITKSGSNQYRGTFYAAAEDAASSPSHRQDQITLEHSGAGAAPGSVNQLWGILM